MQLLEALRTGDALIATDHRRTGPTGPSETTDLLDLLERLEREGLGDHRVELLQVDTDRATSCRWDRRPIRRWLDRARLSLDDTAGQIAEDMSGQIAQGRCVVIVHGVRRRDAAIAARAARRAGLGNIRHTGRWTSNERGTLPSAHQAIATAPHEADPDRAPV